MVARVADPQANQLDRIDSGDEDDEVLNQSVAGLGEAGVALAVTDDGRCLAAAGTRCR
jgi:hypothetical protein